MPGLQESAPLSLPPPGAAWDLRLPVVSCVCGALALKLCNPSCRRTCTYPGACLVLAPLSPCVCTCWEINEWLHPCWKGGCCLCSSPSSAPLASASPCLRGLQRRQGAPCASRSRSLLGAKWSLSVLSQQVGAPCLTAVIVPEINNLASFSIVWARRAEAWRHVIF